MLNYFQIPTCITKLGVGHEQVSLKSMHKVLVQTVTLAFNLATWFLFATYYPVMMIICAKLFLNPTMHNKVMGRTQTGSTEVTHCLVVMIICAKLFFNPTMHNKVLGRTQTGSTEVYTHSLSVDCDL